MTNSSRRWRNADDVASYQAILRAQADEAAKTATSLEAVITVDTTTTNLPKGGTETAYGYSNFVNIKSTFAQNLGQVEYPTTKNAIADVKCFETSTGAKGCEVGISSETYHLIAGKTTVNVSLNGTTYTFNINQDYTSGVAVTIGGEETLAYFYNISEDAITPFMNILKNNVGSRLNVSISW